MNIELNEKQEKVRNLAKEYHKDQVRKYTAEPYFNHLVSVAETCYKYGLINGIEIGLLHDIIEDTKMGETALYWNLRNFGYIKGEASYIVSGVVALTDVFTKSSFPYLNRRLRKKCEAERLGVIGHNFMLIKCADLLDNSKSIIERDPKFASVYLTEKHYILNNFGQVSDHPLYKEVKSQLITGLIEISHEGATNI